MNDELRPTHRVRTRASKSVGSEPPRRSRPEPPPPATRAPLVDYRLVVLTNGRPCLRETLEAFRQFARPGPVELVIVDDGATASAHELVTPWNGVRTIYEPLEPARGFCGATAAAWEIAGEPGADYVFWLEDDFVLTRTLEVGKLAESLDVDPGLVQMALYRDPYSDEEHAAGGYLNLPGRYYEPFDLDGVTWFEHRLNWTTNPSLFRRELAVEHPWPGEASECEGKFGFQLRSARDDVRFGIWGDGSVWVRHVGARAGFGY